MFYLVVRQWYQFSYIKIYTRTKYVSINFFIIINRIKPNTLKLNHLIRIYFHYWKISKQYYLLYKNVAYYICTKVSSNIQYTNIQRSHANNIQKSHFHGQMAFFILNHRRANKLIVVLHQIKYLKKGGIQFGCVYFKCL